MKHILFSFFFFAVFLNVSAQNTSSKFDKIRSDIKKAEDIGNAGNYRKALEVYNAVYAEIETTDSVKLQAEILNEIGLMYDYSGEYTQSLNFYLNALKICEKANLVQQKAATYNNIGALYLLQNKYSEALAYFELSLSAETESGNRKGIAQSYENIGIIHKKQKRFDMAESFYLDAYEIYKNMSDSAAVSNVFHNLGVLYFTQNMLDKAVELFDAALKIQEKSENNVGKCYTLNSLGETYLELNKFSQAIEYLKKSLSVSQKIGLISQSNYSYKLLSNVYEKANDFKESLRFHKLHLQLNDSIFNSEKNRQFEELMLKYETAKNESIIVRQNAELKNNRTILWFIVSLTILFIFFSGFISLIHFKKRRAYKSLVQLNVELAAKMNNEPLTLKEEKNSSSVISVRDNDFLKSLKNKLSDFMEREKPYLKSSFSIDDLAEAIESNSKYVSKIINDFCGSNFSTYVNKRRIEHARLLLLNPKHDKLTLQAIAEMSGFNNRATFISAFKKYTGVTPSYFLEHKNEFLQ